MQAYKNTLTYYFRNFTFNLSNFIFLRFKNFIILYVLRKVKKHKYNKYS